MRYDELSNYDKGIFWGLGSFVDRRFVFRHYERYFIDRMKSYVSNSVYEQKYKGRLQYVLKSGSVDIGSFIDNGWTTRNAEQRNVPVLDNYKDFLRGYIELHSSLKYGTRYPRGDRSKKYRSLVLIIYGNYILMESLNDILHQEARVNKKKVQILSDNKKTAGLYFASLEEITRIYDYIYDIPNCQGFWNMVYEKLKTPVEY